MEPVLIEGHSICECGTITPNFVYHSCKKRCLDCFTGQRMKHVTQIEIMNRGRKTSVPLDRPAGSNAKKKPKRHTDAARRRRQDVDMARRRAMKRLRFLYPEMYEILYAQERARAGMQPILNPAADYEATLTTYEAATAYHPDEPRRGDAAVQLPQAHPRGATR